MRRGCQRLAAESTPDQVVVYYEQADFLIQDWASGSAGGIPGVFNILPMIIACVYNLYQADKLL
ncbi:hypothetical protein PG994_006474 [Apiospora phragmitis]|uniref:Uncharacterized protein n=1 Tax=Apiospora phragmitis TaxID=2905665 RepID=A0ABR1VIZ3_9PEZI